MISARDINCYRQVIAGRPLNQLTANLPGGGLIEFCKLENLLLLKQFSQYIVHVHILL
jgi:hypothetical protein